MVDRMPRAVQFQAQKQSEAMRLNPGVQRRHSHLHVEA